MSSLNVSKIAVIGIIDTGTVRQPSCFHAIPLHCFQVLCASPPCFTSDPDKILMLHLVSAHNFHNFFSILCSVWKHVFVTIVQKEEELSAHLGHLLGLVVTTAVEITLFP